MRKHLTGTQKALLAGFLGLGLLLTPLSFLVMFLTVNDLLAPSLGGWAWVVPVGTEIGFTGLYLADILLESLRVPAWLLRPVPYLLAAASLWLNAMAAHGSAVGMVGHSVVPVVFFGYLLAAKAVAKRLAVTDEERARKQVTSDAIAHARDILRAADRWWRFRAPVLLRRQLRTRRLPATVLDAIDNGVRFGGAAKWEPVVEAWITRSLSLPEGVAVQLAAAREAASRPVPPRQAEVMPATIPETAVTAPVGEPSGQPEGAPPVTARGTSAAPRRAKPKQAPRLISDEDLDRQVRGLFDTDPSISIKAAAARLGRSRDRISPILTAIQNEANVRPMERRA